MAISERIDQLHRNPNMVSRPAHAAFHHIAHTQLLRDFFKIARDATLVLHDRSATNHFQILDLGQIRKQFILDTVGKVSVLLFLAQIFQRQHGDAFGRNRRGRVLEFFLRAANRPKSNTQHRYQEQSRDGCGFKSKGCSRLL